MSNAPLFLPDEGIQKVEEIQDIDLLAAATVAEGAPTFGAGNYICFEYRVSRGQVFVVKGIAPFARQRINIGAGSDSPPSESNAPISSAAGSNWFSFAPKVNDAAVPGYLTNLTLAAPRLAGGTLNNKDKQRAAGITVLSDNPRYDCMQQWDNPLYTFVVPSDAVLRIVFSILPVALASPLVAGGRFSIASDAAAGQRVDYAGAMVVGMQMPEVTFKRLAAENALMKTPRF